MKDPSAAHREALRHEQRGLERLAAAVAAETAAGGDDAVVGKLRDRRGAHDVADGARGAGTSRETRDVAVRRDVPGRNAAEDAKHAPREFGGGARRFQKCTRTPALICTPPV